MVIEIYSKSNAAEILRKVNEKGWHAYQKSDNLSPEQTIHEGPSDELYIDENYVLLPVADIPNDYSVVMNALERLAVKLDRKQPTIMLLGSELPFLGFGLFKHYVHTHTPPGVRVDYNTFIKSLETLVDTRK